MLILYTPITGEPYDTLKAWFAAHDYTVKEVGPAHLGYTMKTLLSDTALEPQEIPTNYLKEPFLYIHLDETEQNELLDKLRQDKVYIRFKAKHTENNENWTLAYLTDHIVEEAREVSLIHKLLAHVRATDELDLKAYPAEKVEVFQSVLAEAQAMLGKFGKEPTPADDIEALIHRLVQSSMEMIQHDNR